MSFFVIETQDITQAHAFYRTSTLVDGIVNYIMGVSFDDPFRFRIVTLEEEEKKSHNQVLNFRSFINIYTQ